MWFIYALASALFASIRRTTEKQLSHTLNHFTIGWTIQLAALPVLFLILLIDGPIFNPLQLGLQFWLPTVLVWFGFYPLNTYLYLSAYKYGKLSKIMPLTSLGPVVSLILGLVLLGQMPSLPAISAIFVIMLGIYVMNAPSSYLHNPLKIFAADKANLYMLGVIVLVALAGVLDTYAIKASGANYYSFVSTLGAVVVLYITARIKKVREGTAIKSHARTLGIAGALFGLSYALYSLALVSGPLAYVTAVRGSTALAIGSFLSYRVLGEKYSIQNVVALGLVLVGSIVLGLS